MKNALISGGAGGLGKAIASELLDSGYRVFAADLLSAADSFDSWKSTLNTEKERLHFVALNVTDYENCVAATEQIEVDVLVNADLAELWEFHQSRLVAGGVEPRVLAVDNLYEELVEHNRVRADRLVEMGLASYVSTDRNLWRFTGKGARVNAVTNQTKGLARAQAQLHDIRAPLAG